MQLLPWETLKMQLFPWETLKMQLFPWETLKMQLLPWEKLKVLFESTCIFNSTIRYKILEGENFGKLQVICQNFLFWLVKNMPELVWMALLKYIQLKSTHKQPLPDPNGKHRQGFSLPMRAGIGKL